MRKALNHPQFGIPWDHGNLTDLDFADDVALLSHSATTLQQMTDSLKTSAEMVGLRISSDKTKFSTVSATDTPILIGQQTLEGVSEFQYLVSIISTNSDVEVDIRAKIGKAASTFQRLCKIWPSHSINLDTKLRLYMSIVIPTALHACETWKIHHSSEITRFPPEVSPHYFGNIVVWSHYQWWSLAKSWFRKLIWDCATKEAEICGPYLTSAGKQTSMNWQAGGQHSVRTYMIWDLLGWVQRDLPATHRNGESSSPIVPAGTGGTKV